MKTYWLITFGCQMNKSDSERIATVLKSAKYKPASNMDEADLIAVNMCSVRQSAVDRIWGLTKKILKMKKRKPKLKTILTGCILKEDKKRLAERFDFVFDIKTLPQWSKKIQRHRLVCGAECGRNRNGDYLRIKPEYQTNFRAYVPIITGCNNFCSYCVVPYSRGSEESRPAGEIIREIRNLAKNGYKDIWLLGENANRYEYKTGAGKPINLPELLKMINEIPGKFWLSFTSSNPRDFSDELIETIAKCEKAAKYISLPVQSGDNEILKKMNRPYTAEYYKNLIKKIRGKIPDVAVSTDAIVGFPGETKKQFENTVKLFKKMKFDMAYIARYSPRRGTAAGKMDDNVSDKEKRRREKILTEVLKRTALENNRKYIGKKVEIIVDERSKPDGKKQFLVGKTQTYKTVKFESGQDLIGKFVKVKITDAMPWGLKGEF